MLNRLSLGLSKKIPVILQAESNECGLACLAMISAYYGYHTDLFTLRNKYSLSAQGTNFTNLIKIANNLNLNSRPLRLELNEVVNLKLPCILHWDLNHFVVLKKVTNTFVIVLDPARGERKLRWHELSESFSGVALELWPNSSFEEKIERKNIKIFQLIGEVKGIWKLFGQILTLALVLEIFVLIGPFFMQWVIDNAIVSADKNLLTTLAIGFGILMFLNQLIKVLQAWITMYMSTLLNVQWKSNIFKHLINLPPEYFIKRHLGDILSRFSSIDAIQTTLTMTFITAILDGLMSIFTLVLIFIYSPSLSIIVLITMLIYIVIRWIGYKPLRNATQEEIIHAAKQNSHFMETIRGIKTVKLFQKQQQRHTIWISLFINEINASLTTQKLGIFFNFINTILFGLENIIIVWLGANFVIDGQFTVGLLMAFIAYKNQFGTRVSGLVDKYIEFKMLNIHGERLADIVLNKDTFVQKNLINNNELSSLNPSIEIKNLKFRYSADTDFIIDDISITISAGESVAIVGPTGCGKSTLMNLLLGVLNPTSGNIKIGGTDISMIGEQALRTLIASVSQDDVLFAGSIAENISFFDENLDQEKIEKIAKMASIHDEIMKMPMAYQTLVGDMGDILSGGQKQRILLARALYVNPKIIFLDEATSNLDVLKEREINKFISNLKITRIIIAHRPETINSVERVIVLRSGKITHDKSKN